MNNCGSYPSRVDDGTSLKPCSGRVTIDRRLKHGRLHAAGPLDGVRVRPGSFSKVQDHAIDRILS
jgi:hypothetical protein